MSTSYLDSVIKQFKYYQMLGDKTFAQLSDEQLFWTPYHDANSVATIVKHLAGNMLSRWTDFLTSDGEKEWRDRDGEFEVDFETRDEMLSLWNKGWECLFGALDTVDDLEQEIYIRNMGHTVTEAINRQLAHYAYHVGQIVLMGKLLKAEGWESLSIPKGGSKAYNADKFSAPKRKQHFTDEFLEK